MVAYLAGVMLAVRRILLHVLLVPQVLERHLTLDRRMKGSDHICSLEPIELARLVRAVREVELALGRPAKEVQPCEAACWLKLGKCLVAARDLPEGHVLVEEDLCVKVADPMGIPSNRFMDVIGKTMRKARQFDESILPEDLGMVAPHQDQGPPEGPPEDPEGDD